MGGIARGIEVLRVHGVGRRGGSRGAVSLCAPHSPAQAVAHRFVRSGSHGAAGTGCEGEGEPHGAAQVAVSTAAHRRVCVRDRRAEAQRQRARAPRQRVCLGLSTFVSATIITPEVWARPCTMLSFVRGGAMPLGTRGGMCPPLPGKSG